MTNAEIIEVVMKIAGWFALLLAAFFGMKSSIEGLRKDHEHTAQQVTRVETKVDNISETLSEMQQYSVRQDQRAADIQERVVSIEGRVTYLERRD